jgi:hypothetical protein
MKSQNTIQLNGNLYDAVTGKMLGSANAAPRPTGGGNIDGFFRARTSPTPAKAVHRSTTSAAVKTVPAPQSVPKASRATINHAKAHLPQVSQRTRPAAARPAKVLAAQPQLVAHKAAPNHAKAHLPQPAVTLMRKAVKRPDPSLKQQVNVQGALTHSVPSLIEVKHNAAAVDTGRLLRANSVSTSPLVAHHAREHTKPSFAVAPLAVQPVPVQPTPTPGRPEDNTPPSVPAPQPNNKPQQDIFDHALANAANFLDVREHRSHFRKHARRHVASMAAGTFALLIIATFAVYQNAPGLQLKLAGVQAGVSTGMPNFAAAGFAYNGVHASSGKLTVGFSDKSGSYQLIQRTTSWSDEDMIQHVSATDAGGRPNYTTVKSGDTTIYRFSNTNATWVSDGKWYHVTGTGALSNDQVKSLVENV